MLIFFCSILMYILTGTNIYHRPSSSQSFVLRTHRNIILTSYFGKNLNKRFFGTFWGQKFASVRRQEFQRLFVFPVPCIYVQLLTLNTCIFITESAKSPIHHLHDFSYFCPSYWCILLCGQWKIVGEQNCGPSTHLRSLKTLVAVRSWSSLR